MKYRWKSIVLCLALGFLLGLGFSVWRIHHRFQDWNGRTHYEKVLSKFSRRLNLTPEQRTKVGTILEAKRLKVDALRTDIHSKFDSIRDATRDEIRAVLNADQKAEFEKMAAKMDSRRRGWENQKITP